MKKTKNIKLYFLGGPVQNVSQTLGLNPTASQRLGGMTDLTEGVLTGNPTSIISGGANMVGAGVSSIKSTFKDKDSTTGDKLLSLAGLAGPGTGIITDTILGNKAQKAKEYASSIKDRDGMFGSASVFDKGGKIHIDPSKRGTFKTQATKMGMGVQEAASKILNAPEGKYSPAMRRKANFAKNFAHADGGLIEYNNGGTHEENEFGGIPMGISPEGQMNTVEQGETRNGDYIFSDRRKLSAKDLDMFNLPKKFKGKTYAEASKILNKEFKERPNDKISKDTKTVMLKKLELASEATMPNDNKTKQFDGGGLIPITPISGIIATDEFKPTLDTTALENLANSRTLDISEIEKDDKQFRNTLKLASIGEDFNNFLSDPSSLRYAPVVGSTLDYLSLKKPEEISLQKSTARYKPNYISTEGLDPKLTALRRKVIADITGTSGGNLATARAGILGANVGFNEGVSDAYRDIALANIQQDQIGQDVNVNTDRFNIGQSKAEEQINAQNQAAYSQAKRQGLQNIFQNIGNIGQEQNLGNIITKAYGYSPTGAKKKCGGKLRFK